MLIQQICVTILASLIFTTSIPREIDQRLTKGHSSMYGTHEELRMLIFGEGVISNYMCDLEDGNYILRAELCID